MPEKQVPVDRSAEVQGVEHGDVHEIAPDLAEKWDVPIYAHLLELPYLDGRSSYPPPDPSVGGGLMSAMARFYPRGPIDVSRWLRTLPAGGAVPGMPGWRWIHTPEHTPGHGPAMHGAEMREALHTLAREFDRVAAPEHGRYVQQPARADASGVTYVPPKHE